MAKATASTQTLEACLNRSVSPVIFEDHARLTHASAKLKIPNASGSSGRAIDYFDHLQIYPGSKTTHFTRIHRDSGIAYDEMLFFDDESRNKNVETLGVTMWLVKDGVTRSEIDDGVKSWRMRTGRTKA
jgi:magnesium-dependent phosphatase 1